MKIPLRLGNDPIIEALFEIRFKAKIKNASTLFPGLLYRILEQDGFTSPEQINQFPIPDEAFKYHPKFRIISKNFVVLIGDYSLVASCVRPYQGWDKFKQLVMKLLRGLEDTGLIETVDRYSIKYINLINEESIKAQHDCLTVKLKINDYNLDNSSTSIRTEIHEDGLLNLIEIQSNSGVSINGAPEEKGLILSVDTICLDTDSFWNDVDNKIDKIHNKEKEIFYSLLTDETVLKFKPEWDD